MTLKTTRHRPGVEQAIGLAVLFLISIATSSMQADGVSEMAAFSVFDKVDPADLARSDVKTAHGPPMETRYLSVQSCYVAPGNPARQMEGLRRWNPLKHGELKVFLHADVHSQATTGDFAKLQRAPDNGSVRALVAATTKMSPELQLSREEAKKFSGSETAGKGAIPANVADFWATVLSGRARSFASGGASAQPPYNHNGETIQPAQEFSSLLRQQEKIRKQFSSFLGQTGISHSAGSSPELYWELIDVDGQGVVTLGASYVRAGGNGPYQAADVLYYASGGYYVALTLYQMWPVTVDGKESTLVWRGDMISSAELATLHGVERLASESAMMKDISKTVTLLRGDTSGSK